MLGEVAAGDEAAHGVGEDEVGEARPQLAAGKLAHAVDVCDEGVEDVLKFLLASVCIESKSRERNYGFPKKTCLKPREAGVDAALATPFAFEEVGIVDKKIVIACDFAETLEDVVEFSLDSARSDFVDGSGKDDRIARLEVNREFARYEEVFTAVESTAVFV